MKKFNFQNRGQGLIGIIIILAIVALISGGAYYYFSRQIQKVPEAPQKTAEEITKPKEITPPKKEIPPKEKPTPEEKLKVTCQNECSAAGSKRCSNNGYQVCGNYDTDNCLEWSSIINCPTNTICQNGACIQKKCTDGTPYGQCSINKPKYCDNGI